MRRGDRVAVIAPNGVGFAAAYWGALRAGATVVPVNPAYTPAEREHIVSDAQIAVAVVADSGEVPAGVTAVPADAIGDPVVAPGAPSEFAVICYTSGTTGRPKGARLTHANLLDNLDAFANLPLLRLQPDDVLLGVLPFFHVFGLNVVLNAAAYHGCAVLAVERFHPASTAQEAARHGVTVAYGPPAVFAALNALPDIRLPRLRAAVSGADALPVGTWQRFADRFGLEILEGYGLTETAPVVASNAGAPAVRPGTVGLPLPGVDVSIRMPDGAAASTGEVGEILVRGPNVFAGYHGRPDETAAVLRDGWFATGDLGALDDDGYLRITGRLKDMVIVNGFNVYPREVEEALLTHPDVAEVAVVGLPDERTGERVRAVVVARPGSAVDERALAAHARERLARYKLPREFVLIDHLPRLPTGKVARQSLKTLPTDHARDPAERA